MAIVRPIAALLIAEHLKRPFGRSVLQLGRQEIMFGARDFLRMCEAQKFTPRNLAQIRDLIDTNSPLNDQVFFRAFGCDEVHAADYDDSAAPDIIMDLNAPRGSGSVDHQYDQVFDGGTLEHVFHTPNALQQIHDILRVGGIVIHLSPSSNAVEHGYYSYSPSFFLEYYHRNSYFLRSCYLIDLGTKLRPINARVYNFIPPIERRLVDGFLNGNVHLTLSVAEKQENSTSGQPCIQGFYEQMWSKERATRPAAADQHVGRSLRAWLRKRRTLDLFVRRSALPVIRLGRMLETRKALRDRRVRITDR
jgi:SAM-dependent methyltransferase